MRNFLFIFILSLGLASSLTSFAANPLDSLEIPPDKQLHLLVSERVVDSLHDTWGFNYVQSAATLLVVSAIKEQMDVNCGGKWDNHDIMANMGGWAVNVLLQELKIEFKF